MLLLAIYDIYYMRYRTVQQSLTPQFYSFDKVKHFANYIQQQKR